MLIVFVYVAFSAAIAISAGIHAGFMAALCAVGGPFLGVVAGGGTREGINDGPQSQRVGSALVGILIGAIAYWIGTGFSVGFFGLGIDGSVWTIFGMVLGFLFARKSSVTN